MIAISLSDRYNGYKGLLFATGQENRQQSREVKHVK